jgi:hypothetical protein
MTSDGGKTTNPGAPGTQDKISKKYRDRPADEGKHGDADEEPNSGVPSSPQDAPGRPKSGSSRQQTSPNQVTQTGAPELDSKGSGPPSIPKRTP